MKITTNYILKSKKANLYDFDVKKWFDSMLKTLNNPKFYILSVEFESTMYMLPFKTEIKP